MELFQGILDRGEYISKLSFIRRFLVSQLVIAKVEHSESSKVSELSLKARQARYTKPVTRQVKLLESLKRQHLLEVEAELWLDSIEW